MANKNIKGYEYIKNVIGAYGCEHCGTTLIFVIHRGCERDDYLDGIVEVCENTNENHYRLAQEYPIADYIIWCGDVVKTPKGDIIHYYWS